jgi:predicted phage terminase large subunit-like protein
MRESSHQQDIDFFRAEARRDFIYYLKVTDPKYILTDAHIYLAKKLQAVAEGKIKRLIISCPPRTGKSRLVSIEFPAWLLGRQNDRELIVTGYAQGFIRKHSREAKNKISSNLMYRSIFPNTRLVEGDSTVDNWAVTGGGRYKAVGVGGPITGLGCNVAIIDDPVKNIEEALSANQLEKIWDWFLSTLYTRLHPTENAIIVTMTRWSRDDIIGRLTSPKFKAQMQDAGMTDPWEIVNLPALAEDNDPLGRPVGAPLSPERIPLEKWMQDKAIQSDYIWASLYCGHPVNKGGNYIKVDRIERINASACPQGLRWVRYWDVAATDKTTSDYQASVCGAIDPSTDILYLKEGKKFKATWPVVRDRIVDIAKTEKIPVGMEAVAGFKAAFQNLLEVMPSTIMCTEYDASKDKLVRALPWIAKAEKYKIKWVRSNDVDTAKDNTWISDFVEELEAFPYGAHDDALDAISGVVHMLVGGIFLVAPVNNRITEVLKQRRTRSMDG